MTLPPRNVQGEMAVLHAAAAACTHLLQVLVETGQVHLRMREAKPD